MSRLDFKVTLFKIFDFPGRNTEIFFSNWEYHEKTEVKHATLSLSRMVRVFAMARETSVQSQVKSYQTLKKMVLDANLLNTQHYEVRIKGKVEYSRERSSALHHTLM